MDPQLSYWIIDHWYLFVAAIVFCLYRMARAGRRVRHYEQRLAANQRRQEALRAELYRRYGR